MVDSVNFEVPIPAPALLTNIAKAVRAFTQALARSVSPEPEEAWLTAAQLELYRNSTRHAAWLMPMAIFFVTLSVSSWVSLGVRMAWFGAVTLVSIFLEVLERHLDETLPHDLAGIRARARCFTIDNSIFLLAWCSMTVFLWVPGVPTNHMMLMLALACSLAASVSAVAMHPALAISCIGLHAVFVLGPTFASSDRLDRTLAGLGVAYVLMLSGQFVASYRSNKRMLCLEHERAGIVHELRIAKEDSDRAQVRAFSAAQAKTQFLSHMSHELRTPMNAILGFSEIIQKKASDYPIEDYAEYGSVIDKYAEYGGIIHESGQTLLAMINGVLDLAKIEGGRLVLRQGDIDLERLLHEAIERQETKAKRASLTLETRIPHQLLWVRGDQRALQEVMTNLLSNAIKFSRPGGRITVFARHEQDGGIAFGVEDTGMGMSPEDQVDAFERFGRGRHDVTTAARGIGLGLAIVKGFAEAHDGTVALRSAIGKGTAVTVNLPSDRVLRSLKASA
jgi:signal transduction histidine kinase